MRISRKGTISHSQRYAYKVILSSTVILRCSDICPAGKLWFYLNEVIKPEQRRIIIWYIKNTYRLQIYF